MDKTAFENKIILGPKSKCCKNSNLECNFGLCNCAYLKKETKANTINLLNSTDFEHKHI